MNKAEKVISFFKKNPEYLVDGGIYNTRNHYWDLLETLYSEDDVIVDYCYEYDYLEIFGLSHDEFEEVATALEKMADERQCSYSPDDECCDGYEYYDDATV